MQPYDIFMLIVLVGAAVFGAWKGMAWQLASIGSVLLSTIVALRFSHFLAPSLSTEEPWNQFLAMGILFAGTSLGVWIAFRFVAKIIDRVKLKEFDRQMGALFGVAKGVLYCLVLTFFAVTLSEGTRQRVLDSRSGYYAAVLVQKGTPMMPEKVRSALGKYIQQLDEGLTPEPHPASPTDDTEGIEDMLPTTAVAGTTPPFQPLGQSDELGAQPAEYQPRAWGAEAWRRDARGVVTERIDNLGRRLDESLNNSYDRFRSSANDAARDVRTRVDRGFDEVGRRIHQPPMERVQ
jgi:membrane protein required for colicin V production